MRTKSVIPSDLSAFIADGKNETYRKIANNTYAVKTMDDENNVVFGIQLHKTVIYAEINNKIVLSNGGWNTVITLDRLDAILRSRNIDSHIISNRGEWLYGKGVNLYDFGNGIIIDSKGDVLFEDRPYVFPVTTVSELTERNSGWD